MKRSRLNQKWDSLKRDELQSLQIRRLRWFLKSRVLPFSAFYRERFAAAGIAADDIRSIDDLRHVPFTQKEDLLPSAAHPARAREFVLIPEQAALKRQASTVLSVLRHGPAAAKKLLEQEFRPILMTSTTGRSTSPVPFLYTAHDVENLRLTGQRLMEVCASDPSWKHANLFPFAPHLAFWQAHYAGTGWGTFCVSTGGGKVLGTSGNVELIDRINADVLIGMPTFIYHILQQAVTEDRHWRHLKRIVLGGEKVPDGLRRKLRGLAAALGSGSVEVMATYGFTEAKVAWPECPSNALGTPTGYHVSSDLGIIEIIDPETGDPLSPGNAGEIVYTALDSRGSVVIRYRTGDQIDGGLVYDACPGCGRTCARLMGNISRVSDRRELALDKLKGTLVDFNALERVLDDLDGIGAWQIELRKRHDDPFDVDQVIVHLAPDGSEPVDGLETMVRRHFRAVTEMRPNRIDFRSIEEIREMQGVGRLLKEEKVRDNRPAASAEKVGKPQKTEPMEEPTR
ncbi:MAG: phenylacetate-CoA ligase [Verrucomicrobiales bacterium]|jgi:phenylacetate-CoA ligase